MAFPLQETSVWELKQLCQSLWDWKLCDVCQQEEEAGQRRCQDYNCPWGQRSERLGPFFDFYQEVTGCYVPDFFGEQDQALRCHQDLFGIIRLIKQYGYTVPRKLCAQEYFSGRETDRHSLVPESDQDRAFDMAVRVLTMTNVSTERSTHTLDDDSDERAVGSAQVAIWPATKTLHGSMTVLFPSRSHPSLQYDDPQAKSIKNSLSAESLRQRGRLTIEGTNNLWDHLKLDSDTGVVQVFHQTTFLKEHLLATKTRDGQIENADTRGAFCLPRELALETLYTLQILFPTGSKSQGLLRTLVSKQGFDPDCLRFGTALFEFPHEKKRALCFPVWGTRLMDLYDEVENPKPRGRLDAWLERRSKSRHIMLATMIGVFTAVLLGMLGLCASILQTWIAWQDWKGSTHPVTR